MAPIGMCQLASARLAHYWHLCSPFWQSNFIGYSMLAFSANLFKLLNSRFQYNLESTNAHVHFATRTLCRYWLGTCSYKSDYIHIVLGTNYILQGCLTNRIHRQILSQNIIELFRRCMVDGSVTGCCDGINRFIIPDQKVMYLFSKYIHM